MKMIIAVAIFAFGSVAGSAQAADAQPGGVVQVFGCHLNDGQTGDNVWALMDALRGPEGAAGPDDPAFGIFLWTPYRGAAPYDFVFGVVNSDLVTMAQGSAAYAASARGQANGMRFASVTSGCDSAIMNSRRLKVGKIGMTADRGADAVIETFTCQINAGSDMDDVNSDVKFWQDQLPKIGSAAMESYDAHLWTPFRGGTGEDFVWVGNSPSLENWAQLSSDYSASAQGQAADKRFFTTSSCTNVMWNGYWIVVPQNF